MDKSSERSQNEIESVAGFLDLLRPIVGDGKERWYRGHRDSTWSVLPSVFRGRNFNYERPMLARFRQEAASVGLQYALDEWGWIIFAQHHSLPTRLLDWSLSPLTALYFACENVNGADKVDGSLLILDPYLLNRNAEQGDGGDPKLLTDGESALRPYLPGCEDGGVVKPRAVIAPMSFERIRAQSGAFTVFQAPRGEAGAQLEDSTALETFIVPAAAKVKIRAELEVLGYHDASIYRDLDRIATRIIKSLVRSVS